MQIWVIITINDLGWVENKAKGKKAFFFFAKLWNMLFWETVYMPWESDRSGFKFCLSYLYKLDKWFILFHLSCLLCQMRIKNAQFYRCQKHYFMCIKWLAHSNQSMQIVTLTTNKINKWVWFGTQLSFLGPLLLSWIIQQPNVLNLSLSKVALRKKSSAGAYAPLNCS